MKILGIDPGTAITGWGMIETDVLDSRGQKSIKVLSCGIISTKAHTPDSDRLEIIYDAVCDIIKREKPESIAVEELLKVINQAAGKQYSSWVDYLNMRYGWIK